jgi:hypothetical protein
VSDDVGVGDSDREGTGFLWVLGVEVREEFLSVFEFCSWQLGVLFICTFIPCPADKVQ